MDIRSIIFFVLCISLASSLSAQVTVLKMLSGLEKFQESYPLPKLPYKYDALEPYIDTATMENHHLGIHAERTLKMNKALAEWRKSGVDADLAKSSLLDILKNLEKVSQPFKEDLRNSIGGYLNHIFYFASLSPNPSGAERPLSTSMAYAIKHSFVNFTNFQKRFNSSIEGVFSTGYVWLVRIPKYRYLTTYVALQETNPISMNYQPILCLDLWEHAYFTKYGNDREEYVRNWWKVVDFDNVEEIMNWWWSFEPRHDEL